MNVERNIKSIFILDLIIGGIGLAPLLIALFEGRSLQSQDFQFAIVGVVVIIAGINLLLRRKWARILHYILAPIFIFGSLLAVAYALVIYLYLPKQEVTNYLEGKN